MATLVAETIIRTGTGLEQTKNAAAGGGDEFVNTGKEFLHVVNGHSSPQTITIGTPNPLDNNVVTPLAIAVPNAEERFIGPFPVSVYNDSAEKVQLTYSGVTALTVAILRPGT